MILYHGTSNNFDKFDLSYFKEGMTTSIICKGIYLTEDKELAQYFSNIVSENKDSSYLYEVVYFDNLLNYEGGINEQPFTIEDFLNSFYGEDVYEELYENIENIVAEETFNYNEEDIEKATLSIMTDFIGGEESPSILNDICNEVDWEKIISDYRIKYKPLPITLNESTGRMVYSNLLEELGSEEKAQEFLTDNFNVNGICFKNERNEFSQEINNYSIWNENSLDIKNKIDLEKINKNKQKNNLKY